MKVLVVDEWLPWPLESGKKIRTFNLISKLAARHEILYLAYVDKEGSDKIKIFKELGIHVLPVPDVRTSKWTIKFYCEVIANFFSSVPFSTQYHITKEFKNRMRDAVLEFSPDLIHCEWTNLAPLLEGYEKIPRVIAAHNIESDIWYRLAANGSNFFTRLLGRVQARRIEVLEKEWYPKVDICIAVSTSDKNVIESYGGKVFLVENGVDLSYYNESPKHIEQEVVPGNKRIVFVASFDTFSNQDGAHYFVNNIFPIIQETCPNVELLLVGKNPPVEIREYEKKNSQINVTGSVPDVRKFIARSHICIVPLRIGGGSRLKILEAMAMHKPVVSTSVGAEGLNIENGKNIILADHPKEFARAVLNLLRNERQRELIGKAGYDLVSKHYDWKLLVGFQEDAWNEARNSFE